MDFSDSGSLTITMLQAKRDFFLFREQSLSIEETGVEGNELVYETTAFAVTGV